MRPGTTGDKTALKGRALTYLIAALVYVILPWDFDFIPLAGRIDDVLVLSFALWYAWKMRPAARRSARGRTSVPPEEDGEPTDPYEILGVAKSASADEVKKAYRDLLGKYHPDRLQHLGGEFREMAARKAAAINGAYESVKRDKGFS